jgi:hypothetical protein
MTDLDQLDAKGLKYRIARSFFGVGNTSLPIPQE